jgi:hypothetical protein
MYAALKLRRVGDLQIDLISAAGALISVGEPPQSQSCIQPGGVKYESVQEQERLWA